MLDPIKELLELTQPYLGRPDLIQGPGGNTSVKDDEGRMFIKASGFRFEEMTLTQGVSCVYYKPVSDYFKTLVVTNKNEAERESLHLVLSNVCKNQSGGLYPKPSMETGFHALLDKYVVHTHSVWSNLINCSEGSTKVLRELKKELSINIAFIPYVSPGLGLSYLIQREIDSFEQLHNSVPTVFFLENHGIIAHGKTKKEVWGLLEAIDNWIANEFSLAIMEYPSAQLQESDEGLIPLDDYCREMTSKEECDVLYFNAILFPDQTVFFKDNIGNISSGKKIQIEDGKVIFNCSLREASSSLETLTAYFFIKNNILGKGLSLKVISNSEADYIQNMDMEKHRKALMNRKEQE
jgi:rhamnose utilization protein RhaD (predicted bifunctional aldolase and dehydrogenase)